MSAMPPAPPDDATEADNGIKSDNTGLPLPPTLDSEELMPPPIEISSDRTEKLSPQKWKRNSISGGQSNVSFTLPEEGTPAAAALAANAEIKMSKTDKLFHKFRGLKRPKMKALNIVKQLKKHTKVKGRKKYKNFKGKVIDGEHELYVITAGIMLGIRCSLENAKVEATLRSSRLTLEDFNYVENVAFPAMGSDNLPYPTPPHSLQRTFKFKSYAPRVFSRLRDLIDIDGDEYLQSICGNYNFIEFMSNSKSGQFFFYSHDGKYMLKTQTKEENKFMKLILPHYYRYLAENPQSLLVRFLGMHRVKMYQFRRKVHFVIMTSVFDTPEEIHKIYDLKGSTHGRAATPKEKAGGGVMKDLDLQESGDRFHLGSKRGMLLNQLEKDAAFLATLGIMDYSLLIGVHYRNRRTKIPGGMLATAGAAAGGASTDIEAAAAAAVAAADAAAAAVASGGSSKSDDGQVMMPATSHSNTPLRRALMAEKEQQAGGGEGGSRSPRRSKSVLVLSKTPQLKQQVVGRIDATEEETEQEAMGEEGSDVEEDDDIESLADSVASQLSDDSDAGSVTTEMISAVEEESALGGNVFYSDTRGLRYSEGSRLSGILAAKSAGETSAGAPGESHAKRGLQSYKGLSRLSQRNILSMNDRSAAAAAAAAPPVASTHGTAYRRDEGDSSSDDDDDASETDANNDSLKLEAHRSMNMPRPNSARSGSGQSARTVQLDARHPWTTRRDNGINSRLPSTDARGDEIYYCGVIDILQLYNVHKRGETAIKGLYLDTSTISSVDPTSYAKRFISFLEEHTD